MCVSSPVSSRTKLPGVHADTGLAVLLTARTRTRTGIVPPGLSYSEGDGILLSKQSPLMK